MFPDRKLELELESVNPLGDRQTPPVRVYLPDSPVTRHPSQSTQEFYEGALTTEKITSFRAKFQSDKLSALLGNSLRTHDIKLLAGRYREVQDLYVSHHLGVPKKDEGSDSHSSTRCWIFASQRCLQLHLAKDLSVADGSELSATYPFFWELFEKANAFLELAIETATKPFESSYQLHLAFENPVPPGGTWPFYRYLFLKYGVVPLAHMPETSASRSAHQMVLLVENLIRAEAMKIRASAPGLLAPELRERKADTLQHVYRILAAHLGTPPQHFSWNYVNTTGHLHRIQHLTPLKFAHMVPYAMDEFVYLTHDPRNPFWQLYTHSRRNVGSAGLSYAALNVPMEYLELLTAHMLLDGHPVWISADLVVHGPHCGSGMASTLTDTLYDYEKFLGTSLTLEKAQRLAYREGYASHAMVMTGVDLAPNGTVQKFLIENSQTDAPSSGHAMTASWFREHVYFAVVKQSYLAPSVLANFGGQPVELPEWDAMANSAACATCDAQP